MLSEVFLAIIIIFMAWQISIVFDQQMLQNKTIDDCAKLHGIYEQVRGKIICIYKTGNGDSITNGTIAKIEGKPQTPYSSIDDFQKECFEYSGSPGLGLSFERYYDTNTAYCKLQGKIIREQVFDDLCLESEKKRGDC